MINDNDKPVKAKPIFYSVCLQPMQEIAKEMGYNLLVHGSMNRDLDLIAVPWCDYPSEPINVVRELDKFLRGDAYSDSIAYHKYMHSVLPGGRDCFAINLNRNEKYNNYVDQQWYLDISFTPRLTLMPKKQADVTAVEWLFGELMKQDESLLKFWNLFKQAQAMEHSILEEIEKKYLINKQ